MTPDPTPQPDHGAAGFCGNHAQPPDEPRVWCETCQHIHIASIPEITYACHRCGFGSWHSETATEHESLCPGHETYSLDHVTRPIVDPAPDERTETVALIRQAELMSDVHYVAGFGPPVVAAFAEATARTLAALDDESARLRGEVEHLRGLGRESDGYRGYVALLREQRDAARAALDRVRAEVAPKWRSLPTVLPDASVEAYSRGRNDTIDAVRAALDSEEPR